MISQKLVRRSPTGLVRSPAIVQLSYVGLSTVRLCLIYSAIFKKYCINVMVSFPRVLWVTNSGIFLSVYFCDISPYSVQMRENRDQKNSEYGHYLRSGIVSGFKAQRRFTIISIFPKSKTFPA